MRFISEPYFNCTLKPLKNSERQPELQQVEYKALLSALLHVKLNPSTNRENVRLHILQAQKNAITAAHHTQIIFWGKNMHLKDTTW